MSSDANKIIGFGVFFLLSGLSFLLISDYFPVSAQAPTIPSPPTGLKATSISSSEIDLSWTAPTNNGGSPITGYSILRSRDGGSTWSYVTSNTGSTATTYAHTGLTAGSTYYYAVHAINSVGISYASNIAFATTTSIPSPPTGLKATSISSSEIDLSWTAPTNNGGSPITGYSILRSRDGGSTWSYVTSNTGSTATTYAHTGLTAGSTYYYAVHTINSIGSSYASNIASATTGFFKDTSIVAGLNQPTAMEFSPDGRIFVSEQGGSLRVIKNGVLLATPFLSIPVDSTGERGLLGIAFDPDFSANGYVYIYLTATSPTIHNVVSRFTASSYNPDIALSNSEKIILSLETLNAVNHNGGAIHFGKDGKLYVAVGNNGIGSYSQSLSTRLGKMLRINSDGTIPSDNPFFNTSGAKKEIWALGLRNPFTFAFQPVTDKMYINDVGENTWEEIDQGKSGANYGWPTCEGVCSTSGLVNPIYDYNHYGGGAAITGGAFYEGSQFPSSYVDNYFFGDYVTGFIKRLTPTNQAMSFIDAPSPVDIKIGPDGSLYYISILNGELHKVQYVTNGNHDPVAVISANPTSGLAPLVVSFDASGSSDADHNSMTFTWDYGDGTATSTGQKVTHKYTADGSYTAKLSVSDGIGGVGTATITINVGNPPSGTIITPAANTKYNAGDTISFSGSGTDTEDGTLPASAYYWDIVFHHNTHTHPFMEFNGIKSGSFTIPKVGETSDNVWYAINLKLADSSGLTYQTSVNILPNKSTMKFLTNLSGLQITLDGVPMTTPVSITGVVGMTRTIGAPTPQVMNSISYHFQTWSDGGSSTHNIATPSVNTTYTANYGQ